jgi:hypothetical protein
MAKDVVNPASSDSVNAEDKAMPAELAKYGTASGVYKSIPLSMPELLGSLTNESCPCYLDYDC